LCDSDPHCTDADARIPASAGRDTGGAERNVSRASPGVARSQQTPAAANLLSKMRRMRSPRGTDPCLKQVGLRHAARVAPLPRDLTFMEAQLLFPGTLSTVYVTTRQLVLAFGDDISEEFARTQVSFGSIRKFVWLTPLNKTKALLVLDLWEEQTGPPLRNVIRYRDDKFTHQIEVRTSEDVEAVRMLGWFDEAVSWGRKRRL